MLVGTVSVEASELLSRMLKREKIPHNVLNAKYHLQEAEIVQRAGQPGTVTISTNMAGRGTDIKLGPGVPDMGGLYVIGTERHESRRIDRQLRGRCARQGDPGASRFYVSFEDDLMRNFGAADRMTKIMERFGLEEGQELEHPLAQQVRRNRAEARRAAQLPGAQTHARIRRRDEQAARGRLRLPQRSHRHRRPAQDRSTKSSTKPCPAKVQEYLGTGAPSEEPNHAGLLHWVNTTFPLGLTKEKAQFETRTPEENAQFLVGKIKQAYERKSSHEEPAAVKSLERYIILNAIDRLWQEHLYAMDALREGVYLRAYAQKDPLIEYKNEAYEMFVELMANIKNEVLHNLFPQHVEPAGLRELSSPLCRNFSCASRTRLPTATGPAPGRRPERIGAPVGGNGEAEENGSEVKLELAPVRREMPKVGRNEPCPCGSGKKYKNCCGRVA